MQTITAKTDKPYEIVIGKGILPLCGDKIKELFPTAQTVIVTDDIVERLYGDVLRTALDQAEIAYTTFVFEHGESSKNPEILMELLSYMAQQNLSRSDFVTALGGGVVGDLAGFAASVFLRGIPYLQIPITLLAAVDASVGGKTAVNLEEGKNLIGSFHQPALVWCDYETLFTMEPDRYADGIAEAVKCAVLCNENLFDLLETGEMRNHQEEIITACVKIKCRLVAEDEHDNGKRQFLNLGHTIGHALEARSDYRIPHGHAIACGLVTIAETAAKNGLADFDCADRIASVFAHYHLPLKSPYPIGELLPYIENDKKRRGDYLELVLPESIGHCRLYRLPVAEIRSFFRV